MIQYAYYKNTKININLDTYTLSALKKIFQCTSFWKMTAPPSKKGF